MVVGAMVLGWQRGLVVTLMATLVMVVAGTTCAALAAVIGAPVPVLAFLIGGILGLIPVALKLDLITSHVDEFLGVDRLRIVDRVGGALLNLTLALSISWFVGALAEIAPSDSSALNAMRSSKGLSALVSLVPPQGPLGVVVLRSGLVPALNGPLVLAEKPDPNSALQPAVIAARNSVLQVRSTACGRIITGTGWVAQGGVIVTNAHVVAGTQRSYLAGGPRYEGVASTVVAFDPINDIAVLVLDDSEHVTRLPPALNIVARISHGEPGAVIGFPLGGEQQVSPARVDRVSPFEVEPIGGGARVVANVLAFRAKVQPGNSGGPLVAEDGSVLGLVVSKALGQRNPAAYGVAGVDMLKTIASASLRRRVSTGACLSEDDLTTTG